jgi:hypothetical protein
MPSDRDWIPKAVAFAPPVRRMPMALFAAVIAAALAASRPASAVDVGPEDGLASVEVHAFASQGFILSHDNNYLASDTTHGSFQFSELGVNLTKSITDRFRMGLQLFAQDLGPTGNYNIRADWFYLDYRLANWLGVRAGRVKIPFGLYNESADIDSARVAVLLPQSVYPEENRNYLLAQTGGEVYGFANLGAGGGLDYRLYGGTIFVENTPAPGLPYQIQSYNIPYLAGGRLMWETPVDGLRLGGSVQTLRLDATLVGTGPASPTMPTPSAEVHLPVVLWVASAEYVAGDLQLAAEYSRWYVSDTSSNTALFPNTSAITSERAYLLATYRAAKWLQPGAYYSIMFPDVDHRDGRENMQHDIATTLRFNLNDNWLVKAEAHYMIGTAGLDSSLNHGTPLSALDQSWGVLLLKTTAYF